MSVAIKFENVSKYFALHRVRPSSFQEMLLGLFKRNDGGEESEEFWALKDVSFSVDQGKTVGIIGPNGVGKSTVLKIASRVIEPTMGHVEVNGNVRALLELGTGFHPDLTGRENVYLNASIMGIGRQHIAAHFDEIVAFSELEPFIDVPVKHYSSGMYVRLAFSVAVHTDPDILLVDEVLSVGDASFQRKCIDRIAEMRRSGVTIMLVSHDLSSIESFCDEALWFDRGEVRMQGDSTDVVMAYMNNLASKQKEKGAEQKPAKQEPQGQEQEENDKEEESRWGSGRVEFTRVELCDARGEPCSVFETGEPMEVHLHYYAAEEVADPIFGLAIYHQNGAHICGPNTQFGGLTIPSVEGEGMVIYRVPALSLLEGTYLLSAAVVNKTNTETYDHHDRMYSFSVYRGAYRETYGLVTLNGAWDIAVS
jgi:lipopolysaccharide transport system ATP-binding protein